MTDQPEIQNMVANEVARQMTTILPKIKNEIASAVENGTKDLRADLIHLANNSQTRHNLSSGYGSMAGGPKAEELQRYLPEKIRQTGLGEIVREVSESYGVDISNPSSWRVYAGLEQPAVNKLAGRSQ